MDRRWIKIRLLPRVNKHRRYGNACQIDCWCKLQRKSGLATELWKCRALNGQSFLAVIKLQDEPSTWLKKLLKSIRHHSWQITILKWSAILEAEYVYVYVGEWHHTCSTVFVLCDLVETPQQRIDVGFDLSQFRFDGLQLRRLHCFHITQSFSWINQQFYIVIKLRPQMKLMRWYLVMVLRGNVGQKNCIHEHSKS